MKRSAFAALFFFAAILTLLQAGSDGGRVHYVGGTVAKLPARTDGRIRMTDPEAMLFESREIRVRVPYGSITNIEYGQRVDRRYAEAILISPLLLLSKKRTHFLTVGYTDEAGVHQAMVFQLGKSDVRPVLVSLEAKSGRKVEYQDDEARKAGKG